VELIKRADSGNLQFKGLRNNRTGYLQHQPVKEKIMIEIHEWQHKMVKGKIVGCILGKEKVESVSKYVNTALKNRWISHSHLDRTLVEVEQESVLPFLGHPWNQPERQQHFNALAEALKI
jgi:hypothetical protein